MTVNELIESLRKIADEGGGDAIVCINDYDECALYGEMIAVHEVVMSEYKSETQTDAKNGDPAVLLI